MNAPIRRVAIVAALMIFALLANTTWISLVRSDSLNAHPLNRRTRDAEFASFRGAILVGNSAVAQTIPNEGRFAYRRTYLNGDLYAPITGHYSYDFARSGLEQVYNTELAGTDNSQFVDRFVDMVTGAKRQGASIGTTVVAKAQQAAWDGLAGRKGAVVALDWRTGAVLAMVSTPSYDPNTLASTDLTEATASWKALQASTDRPMANRASREIYPPGSTFKLVTAAAALDKGLRPTTQLDSPSSFTLPQSSVVLTNEVDCGGTTTTLQHALEISCNTAFAKLGLTIGADDLRTQAQRFGFDSAVGGDLNAVASKFPAAPDAPQTALSSIGQFDVAASPLQMAMVAAGIANDGTVMEPYLVQEVRSPSLALLSSHQPTQLSEAMTASNARFLQDMMVGVVTDGTGGPAAVSGVRVGGKTGTAQSDPDRPPYAWFVGFAEDPEVAIAVFIEDANIERAEIAGGRLAGPIFKAVVEALR